MTQYKTPGYLPKLGAAMSAMRHYIRDALLACSVQRACRGYHDPHYSGLLGFQIRPWAAKREALVITARTDLKAYTMYLNCNRVSISNNVYIVINPMKTNKQFE